mmetsp:Transcript_2177/g.5526  ORF Transcript_2177/g.5526 Transcript_2177/m.5526 type:complete len:686 (+) Transcript_2177:306-2363(+)
MSVMTSSAASSMRRPSGRLASGASCTRRSASASPRSLATPTSPASPALPLAGAPTSSSVATAVSARDSVSTASVGHALSSSMPHDSACSLTSSGAAAPAPCSATATLDSAVANDRRTALCGEDAACAYASSSAPALADAHARGAACLNRLAASRSPSCVLAAGASGAAAVRSASGSRPDPAAPSGPAPATRDAPPPASSATSRATSRPGNSCAGGHCSSLASSGACGPPVAGNTGADGEEEGTAGSWRSSASSPPAASSAVSASAEVAGCAATSALNSRTLAASLSGAGAPSNTRYARAGACTSAPALYPPGTVAAPPAPAPEPPGTPVKGSTNPPVMGRSASDCGGGRYMGGGGAELLPEPPPVKGSQKPPVMGRSLTDGPPAAPSVFLMMNCTIWSLKCSGRSSSSQNWPATMYGLSPRFSASLRGGAPSSTSTSNTKSYSRPLCSFLMAPTPPGAAPCASASLTTSPTLSHCHVLASHAYAVTAPVASRMNLYAPSLAPGAMSADGSSTLMPGGRPPMPPPPPPPAPPAAPPPPAPSCALAAARSSLTVCSARAYPSATSAGALRSSRALHSRATASEHPVTRSPSAVKATSQMHPTCSITCRHAPLGSHRRAVLSSDPLAMSCAPPTLTAAHAYTMAVWPTSSATTSPDSAHTLSVMSCDADTNPMSPSAHSPLTVSVCPV